MDERGTQGGTKRKGVGRKRGKRGEEVGEKGEGEVSRES